MSEKEMSEERKWCECGTELVADVATTYGAEYHCPKCDDTIWKKMARNNKKIDLKDVDFIIGGEIGKPMNVFINIDLEAIHNILEKDTKQLRLKQKIEDIK